MELTTTFLACHSILCRYSIICVLLFTALQGRDAQLISTNQQSQTSSHVTSTESVSTSQAGLKATSQSSSSAARRNCTSRLVGDVYLPCQPDSCFYRNLQSSNGSGHVEPCLPGNHEVVAVKHFSTYSFAEQGGTQSLPKNRWLLLKDESDNCMHILPVNSTDSACMLPGYCNSQFPWYVRQTSPLLPTFGAETRAELCMTDTTSLDKAACCRHPIRLRIRSCGFYWIYNLLETMSASAIGEVCSEKNSIAHEMSVNSNNSVVPLSSLNIKYTTQNGQLLPKTLDELNEAETNSLMTVIFEVFNFQKKTQIKEIVNAYHKQVVEEWNTYLGNMVNSTEDEPMHLGTENIYRIAGSPEYLPGTAGSEQYFYTVYAKSDDGEVLPQSLREAGFATYDNTKFTPWNAYIKDIVSGYPEELSYPYRTTTAVTVSIETSTIVNSLKTQSNYDWRIIMYIAVSTIVIIALTFLALCAYRVKLSKGLRSNRSRRLSRIEKWLLCKESTTNETELPLKEDVGVGPKANGNGSHDAQRQLNTETSEP
ncbi:uncharacterized protein [Watersipora subatra]|uniref:uncharacterized protein n=1 Tax=Watersipora subatra TaxID=2589382 RepID=UPI00355C4ACC